MTSLQVINFCTFCKLKKRIIELDKVKKNPLFIAQYPCDQLSHSHKRRDALSGGSGD